MRSLATFCLVIVATAALSQAVAGEAETIEAINASSNALDKAFDRQHCDQGADDARPYLCHPILRRSANHRRPDRVAARAEMGAEDRG